MGIKLVAGLGNPGAEYANTRHNAGYQVVDELADRLHATYWKQQCGCLVAQVSCEESPEGQIILAKPQSFMNECGGPLKRLLAQYRVTPAELLVVHDELELPAGEVRFKQGGGHAGHNGLRSLIEKTGSRDFSRVRMGIGRPPGRMDPAAYVLQPLRNRDAEDFAVEVALGADVALYAVEHGAEKALRAYGGKR